MKIYVRRSDGIYAEFEGMSQAQVTAMLFVQGLTCDFLDESQYQAVAQAAQ